MRKSFLYIRLRNILYAPLFLLLIVSPAITGVSATPEPQVYVDPPSVTIEAPSENATIAINVSDVTIDVSSWSFWLGYNTTLLDAVEVTIGDAVPGSYLLGPLDPDTYEWIPINDTEGMVRVGLTGITPPWFTGNGTMAWITFNGTTVGVSVLELIDQYTVLFDVAGDDISSLPPVDGEIVVIPEFPAAIVMPLLLIATLAATFLGKMVWSRKRKDALIAE